MFYKYTNERLPIYHDSIQDVTWHQPLKEWRDFLKGKIVSSPSNFPPNTIIPHFLPYTRALSSL